MYYPKVTCIKEDHYWKNNEGTGKRLDIFKENGPIQIPVKCTDLLKALGAYHHNMTNEYYDNTYMYMDGTVREDYERKKKGTWSW